MRAMIMREHLPRWIDRIEELVLVLLMSAMTIVTFSQVVARYVFNSGAVWALELTVYLFAWLVLLGASMLVRTGAHIGIDAFTGLFGPRMQRGFGLAAILVSLLYAALMLYGAWDYVSRIARFGIEAEDLPVPLWIPLAALPLGIALLLARLVQALVAHLRGGRSGLIERQDEHRDLDAGMFTENGVPNDPATHGAVRPAASVRPEGFR